MLVSMLVVMFGGAVGSALRWLIASYFNGSAFQFPVGTLIVNLIGCFLMGAALAVCLKLLSLDPEWKIFIISGFCGGLTTFSSFSAETMMLLQRGNILLAVENMTIQVIGSLLMTCMGFFLINMLKG